MSRVALINPAVNFQSNLGSAKRFAVKVAPLGLAYIGAMLNNGGDEVLVVDQFAEVMETERLVARVAAFRPDVVGFNLLTASATIARHACGRLREALPGTRIVLGNIHASIFHERILAEGWADVVVHGEGEHIVPQLVACFRERRGLDAVPSISYRDGGETRSTARAGQLSELDALPFPAWQLFNLDSYRTHSILTYGQLTLPVITSRGCPWNCPFCSQNHFWKRVVLRDPDSVAQELLVNFRRFGCSHHTFHDANFPVSKKYGLSLAEAMVRAGLPGKATFVTEARLEVFDEELICALKRAGCKALMFGIESGSERVRGTIGKTFSNQRIREIVGQCDAHHIDTMGLFLFGLPGETRADAEETIALARELPLDLAKFNIVVPYPGSELFAQRFGVEAMTEADFDKIATFYADGFSALVVNEHMTAAQLDRLQKRGLYRFFFRPSAIRRLLRSNILSWGDIAVGALAIGMSALRGLKNRLTSAFRFPQTSAERRAVSDERID